MTREQTKRIVKLEAAPTAWSYQQACRALEKHRCRADTAEKRNVKLEGALLDITRLTVCDVLGERIHRAQAIARAALRELRPQPAAPTEEARDDRTH